MTETLPATTEYNAARDAITAATNAANAAAATGATAEQRSRAITAIAEARTALKAAVDAANKAVTDADEGDDAAYGRALRAQTRATDFEAAQKMVLARLENPFLWFTRELVRQRPADGVAFPADETNTATIMRVNRTMDTSTDDSTQIANTEAGVIKSTDFAPIMYADEKMVFLTSDDAEGGDEFRVDGYVTSMSTVIDPDFALKTGLKITSDGVEIRTGGPVIATTVAAPRADASIIGGLHGNYLDLRKKVTTSIGTGATDTAGWDLTIKFNEPQTRSVVGDDGAITSWTGNGEFYWRAIAKPDRKQLSSEQTAYYDANAFTRPEGYERLGTYDLFLSNHIGFDQRLEPVEGSGAPANPGDDENFYLQYAAYGMFLFQGDPSIVGVTEIFTRTSRVQAMHFGYEAFKDETGMKTSDIGEAITRATFRGQTRAFAYKGNRFAGSTSGTVDFESKHLRGDVSLLVSIPQSSDSSGSLSGTMNKFQEWTGIIWKDLPTDFKIDFDDGTVGDAMEIGDGGTFRGKARLTAGSGDLTPTTVNENGIGEVSGNFYGPLASPDDLEIAGSWVLGHLSGTIERNVNEWIVLGSFGAKQRPSSN